jgi:DNA-binding NarL/FixJ family response regulator
MQLPSCARGAQTPARSVYLIDDHPVVALGLRLAFRDKSQFELVGTATNPLKALSEIELRMPDAIVVDLVLTGVVELSLVARCREAARSAAIVIFSSLPARLYEREALSAGADAYLSKEHDLSCLVRLLSDIMAQPEARPARTDGTQGPASMEELRKEPLDGIHLTFREKEIGRLLGNGHSVNRIAHEIGLSPKTVAAHRDNLRKKLDCRSSNELVARLAKLYDADGRRG